MSPIFWWFLISILIIIAIVFREPNVESVGALIQDSIAKEEEPVRPFDIMLFAALLLYMRFTLDVIDGKM